METISQTEENYLKAIFKLSEKQGAPVNTNSISGEMNTSAASVSDMIGRLAKKELLNYEKWRGVTLSKLGRIVATSLIRKHRLWEVFLVEKLDFSWDEVHDIAEQLEHIKSPELVERLDLFLGRPKFDPHGDPIPDADGQFTIRQQILLSELKVGQRGIVVGVQEHSTTFLQYLDQLQLVLGAEVKLVEKFKYDESVKIILNGEREQLLSQKVSQNLFIQKQNS